MSHTYQIVYLVYIMGLELLGISLIILKKTHQFILVDLGKILIYSMVVLLKMLIEKYFKNEKKQ